MITNVMLRTSLFAAIAALALLAFGGSSAQAAAITVNTTADELNTNGNCSLREAIQAANTDTAVDACTAGSGTDVITVPAGTYPLTIAGTDEGNNQDGDLDITTSMEINGAGAASTIIDSEATGERHFDIPNAANVIITGLTLTGAVGDADGGSINIDSENTVTLHSIVITDNIGQDAAGIDNSGDLVIVDTTISNNTAEPDDSGGGIRNGGSLEIERSTISGNSSGATGGGGIENFGQLLIVNSTISGNTTTGTGGGILTDPNVTLRNSTIAGNSATVGGGGISDDFIKVSSDTSPDVYVSSAPDAVIRSRAALSTIPILTVNTIIAGNTTGGDCSVATLTSDGNNLDSDGTCALTGPGDQSSVDPQLAALANNGGVTQTHALALTSPAVDAGNNETCESEDQREVARPIDANGDGTNNCDIGAFELQPQTPGPSGTPTLAPITATPAGLPDTGSSPSDGGTSLTWLLLAALGALAAMGGGLWWARGRLRA
jgi:CSLREA domain-containing protein